MSKLKKNIQTKRGEVWVANLGEKMKKRGKIWNFGKISQKVKFKNSEKEK